MKNSLIKKLLIISMLIFSVFVVTYAVSEKDELEYLKLSTVDIWSFNESRYRIIQNFFLLKQKYEIDWVIDKKISNDLLLVAQKWANYLPDNLKNENYYRALDIAVKRWMKDIKSEWAYNWILLAIWDFLDKTEIKKVEWTIEAFPTVWNAPMTTSLRARVKDPTWTKIEDYNYTWWINVWWKTIVIWKKPSISYTFRDEWTFTVFLDVKSSHKNSRWYSDTLPLRIRQDIEVQEKIASLIVKVWATDLKQQDNIKFTPEDALYGIVFDATSSTPTNGSKFIKTSWDFWNGVKKEYSTWPRVERIIYNREWEYPVSLELTTNELKKIKREFTISVHKPIATINSSQESWFLWDKFTFSAKPSGNEKNLNYAWKVIDIDNDKTLLEKSWNLITYNFNQKWKFNILLKVSDLSSWNKDYDIDSKVIYINSREPVAEFSSSNTDKSRPNRYLLDATKSYDPDFLDEWKLNYSWLIDWEKINLEESNAFWSYWYYTFDSVWEHSVVLQVTDPDSITSEKKWKVIVDSILAVDFSAFPRVAQRDRPVNFVASSPEAIIYEWDFWDWEKKWWKYDKITHVYKKSGTFNVKLTVNDKDNKKNTFEKNVYIGESDSVMAFINANWSDSAPLFFKKWECADKGTTWAYMTDRVNNIKFSWVESVNIDWTTTWLSYSWKLNNAKYFTTNEFTYKFDELGCFPVKLTVSSIDWKTDNKTIWVKVENKKPTLSSLNISVVNLETDPVVVNVSAVWSKDEDGWIQTYLWYYYTDTDPEPQDFRWTKMPNTTFVLPKITWNYYFVVVMKDNNEERTTSEEITWSKYFVTLAWDNLNTPIIDLKVNNSSVAIWDEVAFTSNVENILGQDISNKVTYSWDFDWDWFYDKEWITWDILYKYQSSWEFHAKLKVKNKWFSNVKSVTINVSNKLSADFSYISVWDRIVFLNKSTWDYDKINWDLWDGETSNKKENFEYVYKDDSNTHEVTLKISKWDKVSSKSLRVNANIKNILKARKDGLNIFSYPDIVDNKITLKDKSDNAYIYLWESKWSFKYFVIDTDANLDSDLNGTKDDDEDNKWTNSYSAWEVYKIPLNEFRTQKVKIYLKDENMTLLDSKDLEIVKEYIKVDDVKPEVITLKWATEEEKKNFEKLKTLIKWLSKDHQSKSLMYMEKLKENWSDKTEKTKTIIEFEWFLANTYEKSVDEINTLLESFLVWDKYDGDITDANFLALKNLLPQDIKCTNLPKESPTCYSYIVDLLEKIYNSKDIDQNKLDAKIILETVKTDWKMSVTDSNNFKTILSNLVYRSNTPPVDAEPTDSWPIKSSNSTSSFWSILTTVWFWFLIIIWGIWAIIGIFFAYYRASVWDEDISFQDFIINKTSWWWNGWSKNTEEKIDVLWNIFWETKTQTPVPDILWSTETKEPIAKTFENPITQVKEEKAWIPSWLKWNTNESKVEETKVIETTTPISENKTEEITAKNEVTPKNEATNWADLPNWLKWSFKEENPKEVNPKENTNSDKTSNSTKTENKTETVKEEKNWPEKKKDQNWNNNKKDNSNNNKGFSNNNNNNNKNNNNNNGNKQNDTDLKKEKSELPSWLKSSSETISKTENTQEKKKTNNLPDWLKTSNEENKNKTDDATNTTNESITSENKDIIETKTETPIIEETKAETPIVEENKTTSELPDWLKTTNDEKTPPASLSHQGTLPTQSRGTEGEKNKDDSPKNKQPKTKTTKNTTDNEETKNNDDELWNDWMQVPDWLKSPTDKK
jgi:hypothetical protein